jgi:hypothetical protein
MKIKTIALAAAFALSSTIAFADRQYGGRQFGGRRTGCEQDDHGRLNERRHHRR